MRSEGQGECPVTRQQNNHQQVSSNLQFPELEFLSCPGCMRTDHICRRNWAWTWGSVLPTLGENLPLTWFLWVGLTRPLGKIRPQSHALWSSSLLHASKPTWSFQIPLHFQALAHSPGCSHFLPTWHPQVTPEAYLRPFLEIPSDSNPERKGSCSAPSQDLRHHCTQGPGVQAGHTGITRCVTVLRRHCPSLDALWY